jgi:predicted unusual protein kinase regulating ubiquinone biosynthesis (AarF/ABC1/UbiB family)
MISENTDPRLQFGVLKPQLYVPVCSRIGSTVRFFQEELVGKSVDTLCNSKMDSINRGILAGKIFIKIIDLLEKIHDNGFVHGDIHVGNIVKR